MEIEKDIKKITSRSYPEVITNSISYQNFQQVDSEEMNAYFHIYIITTKEGKISSNFTDRKMQV